MVNGRRRRMVIMEGLQSRRHDATGAHDPAGSGDAVQCGAFRIHAADHAAADAATDADTGFLQHGVDERVMMMSEMGVVMREVGVVVGSVMRVMMLMRQC